MAILTALLSSEIDLSADELRFDFEDNEGHRHHIPMKGGVAAALLLSLLSRLRERVQHESDRNIEEMALELNDATAMSFENRRIGLRLQLESNLRFSFGVNSRSVNRLRLALSQCDELMKERKGPMN